MKVDIGVLAVQICASKTDQNALKKKQPKIQRIGAGSPDPVPAATPAHATRSFHLSFLTDDGSNLIASSSCTQFSNER
jgi:hypothetical protein